MNKVTLRRMPMALLAAGVVLLTGCSLSPTYERPASPVAPQWSVNAVHQPGQKVAASSAALDWQAFVTDESLRKLIEVAIANNRDLRQALLNVEAARAQYRVQRADRLPGINADAAGSRQHVPADMSATQQAGVQSEWRAGVGLATFEIDLFGRVRNLSEAALQEYLATEGGARSAQITLLAEVIQTYLTRNGAQQRRALTADTLQAREASLKLIAQRRELGVGSALDYQEALGLTEQAKADLERDDREVRQSSNALGLLVGVSDISALLPTQPSSSNALVQNLAPGVPAELLTYRPDIQAAEHRLQARNADIGAARAAFFPRISLTGMFGSASADLSDLFSSGQRAWSFSPQLTLPIFAGGGNRANVDLAAIRKDIAIAEYEKTIQTAFREVSDALAATDTLQREEQAQRALAKSSVEAQRLSEARYRGGVDGYLRYLEAQRRAFASQSTLIDVQTQRQIALATLFRALGGGWSDDNVINTPT